MVITTFKYILGYVNEVEQLLVFIITRMGYHVLLGTNNYFIETTENSNYLHNISKRRSSSEIFTPPSRGNEIRIRHARFSIQQLNRKFLRKLETVFMVTNTFRAEYIM